MVNQDYNMILESLEIVAKDPPIYYLNNERHLCVTIIFKKSFEVFLLNSSGQSMSYFKTDMSDNFAETGIQKHTVA